MGREEGREGGCFVYLIFSLAQIINCLMHYISSLQLLKSKQHNS